MMKLVKILLLAPIIANAYRVTFLKRVNPGGNAVKAYVNVEKGETILDALERESIHNIGRIPLSRDCSRGSCLTCACRIAPKSQSNVYNEARPIPTIPNDAKVKNYILPCNSVPVNDNLVIEWDDDGTIQDDLWKLVMQERFSDELHHGSDAAAKEISRWARSQKDDWVRKTEKTLEEDL